VSSKRRSVRLALSLRVLPWSVAHFAWRAQRHANRIGDAFSVTSAARPRELAELLCIARGRTTVVELGTGTAWSSIALALDDGARQVISYDSVKRRERESYLDLAGRGVRERIDLRDEPDSHGPRTSDPPVELLFIDSSHERVAVVTAFRAWRAALASDAAVVFHDYDHPRYPGVREAVIELGLDGQSSAGLFVWRVPAESAIA
jgi:predicted O-methyltransferase YrrM